MRRYLRPRTINFFWFFTFRGSIFQVRLRPIAPERSARRELSPLSAKLNVPRAVAEITCDTVYVKMDLEKNMSGDVNVNVNFNINVNVNRNVNVKPYVCLT